MPFDSFSEAMASPAETSDKIAFAAGYVSTWLVAVAIVGGVPYYGFKKLSSRTKVAEVSDSVASLLAPGIEISSDDEESFDFDVSGLPDEFQALLNAKRREHLELWKEYRIGECVEKQAHFTQIVLSTNVMVPGDPDATFERLKPFYWLIGMSENADLELAVPQHALFGEPDDDDDESEAAGKIPSPSERTPDRSSALMAYGLEDFGKPLKL